MKSKERHQLKGNEVADVLASVQDVVQSRGRQIGLVIAAIAVVAVGVAAFMTWRGRSEAQAELLLADAMVAFNARVIPASATPTQPGEVPAAATIGATGSFSTEAAKLTAALPKLQAAADAYPDSKAGITARYHYASSLAALGRTDDAIQAFDTVITKAGADSLYGRMAKLGKADAQARGGRHDAAIASWKDLVSTAGDALPKDAILMELAKAYQAAGNTEEARRTFNQVVDEFPTSSYVAEARAALGS